MPAIQVVTESPSERGRKIRSWVLIVLTTLISLVCLTIVLKDAPLSSIWSEVRQMSWRWVAVAVIFDVCVYLLHGLRWKLLLAPVKRIPFVQCVEAIYVGLFANEVLPLRAGEVIRCFLLSKSSEVPISVSFASALIERLFDGVWLMTCFFLALRMGKPPKLLLNGGYAIGIIMVVLAIVLAFAMYSRKQSLGKVVAFRWPAWFNTLIDDLHLIGHSRYLYSSFLVSGFYMLCQMAPLYATVRAADLDVPWHASFTMLVLLRLSSIVPQAPGNLGVFNLVAAQSLVMFGLDRGLAKIFSIQLWGIVTLPLMAIGFIALAIEGVNLSHLHREATEVAKQRKTAAQ